MGMPSAWVSSRTIAYRRGYSCSVTARDRVVAMAILSENHYRAKLMASPMSRKVHPPAASKNAKPMSTNRPPSAAMSIHVLARLIPITCTSRSFGSAVVLSSLRHQLTSGSEERGALRARQRGERREVRQELGVDPDGQDGERRQGRHPRDQGRGGRWPLHAGLDEDHLPGDTEVVVQADHRVQDHDHGQPGAQAPAADRGGEDEELGPEAAGWRDAAERDHEHDHPDAEHGG